MQSLGAALQGGAAVTALPVTALSLSPSCAPWDKTVLRAASTKYPERAGHSSDGQSNTHLSHRDLISFLTWQ